MKVVVKKNISVAVLESFLAKQKKASFYHGSGWLRVASETLGLKPTIILAFKKNILIGILPLFFRQGLFGGKRLMTLPLGDWTGPLGDREAKRLIINKALELAQNWHAILEIYTPHPLDKLPKGLHQNEIFGYYLLSTRKSFAYLFEKIIHKKTRNMIRKAEKVGIKVMVAGKKELKKFYQLYLLTSRKLGVLPLPFQVFETAWQVYHHKSKLFKAVYKKQIVGFLWTFYGQDTVWIWANVSDNKLVSLGINYALYAQAIKVACASRKIGTVDFGGSEYNSPHEFFKLRWGTSKKSIFLISNSEFVAKKRIKLHQQMKAVIHFLPLRLVNFFGTLAYRFY